MSEFERHGASNRLDPPSPHILAETDARHALPAEIDASGSGDFAENFAADEEQAGAGYTAASGANGEEPWRRELRRWLLTLNPGRTQYEYEKAVTYFFTTPGVPQSPDALTFDLLLAYRGALALRATAHAEFQSRRSAPSGPRLADARRHALPGEASEDAHEAEPAEPAARERSLNGPLAPATVNLRLTALRQFLMHCALSGSLPQLSPDRIRAALKRLSIERRRPYQVLSEPEWEAFLAAARLPLSTAPAGQSRQANAAADGAQGGEAEHPATRERSPWGMPRSMRARARAELAEQGAPDHAQPRDGEPGTEAGSRQLPHSRAGLTGERTAQRDHALIALALATGLRAIELASLDVGDLSREWHAGREEWWLVLPDKKTKGQRGGRALPLDGELITTLMGYVEATGRRWERPRDRATPLFLSGSQSPTARPRKKATAGEAGSSARERAARLSPHSIRCIVDRVETQWLALRRGADGEHRRRGRRRR